MQQRRDINNTQPSIEDLRNNATELSPNHLNSQVSIFDRKTRNLMPRGVRLRSAVTARVGNQLRSSVRTLINVSQKSLFSPKNSNVGRT